MSNVSILFQVESEGTTEGAISVQWECWWVENDLWEELRRGQCKGVVSCVCVCAGGDEISYTIYFQSHARLSPAVFECAATHYKFMSIFPPTLPPNAGCFSKSTERTSGSWLHQSFTRLSAHFDIGVLQNPCVQCSYTHIPVLFHFCFFKCFFFECEINVNKVICIHSQQ